MTARLPPYFFRIRENGAAVYRVDTENRQRRIEMDQIAVVNAKSGDIRPQGGRELSVEDMAAIRAWLEERQATLARREAEEMLRVVEGLNHAAHWIDRRASDDQIEEIGDALLLAMHDLRSAIVRRRAERLMKGPDAAE